MSDFLIDTLLWTGALIALVLLIRRPVAALFGPKVAYALWALPMARLLLPPLVLPAWMAPARERLTEPALATAAQLADGPMTAALAGGPQTIAVAQVERAPSYLEALGLFEWTSLLLPLWLTGAAVFLIRRYALYFEMRRDLLKGARAMGEAGRVRLIETPAADGPVAFGVLDKVVALPPGFMADRDRAARDLALAHELAHHRGHDLVCNMLVQPLFALHWFNPLSLLGWRALRRDQESACDARVMASQPRERRAAYAAVIARFAVQPRHAARLALAAPMACPVLGDRSIVQRLRSLKMNDISTRRRWSGRLLIAAGALALPLTGSISYAQSDRAAPPAPPAPPVPPVAAVAPLAPAAPVPPPAPEVTIAEDGRRIVRIERHLGDVGEAKERRIEKRIVLHPGGKLSPQESARLEKEQGRGKHVTRRVFRRDGKEMTAEERAEFHKEMSELREELQREFGEHGEFQKEMRRTFGENGEFQREIQLAVAEARATAHAAARVKAPKVSVRCRDGQRDVTETVTSHDGQQHIFVCNAVAMADARKAIAEARKEIARTHELSGKERAEALRSLDEAERSPRAH